MKLQQYDFTIKHRPRKENKNADALSRMYEKEREVPIFLLEVKNTKDGKAFPDFLLNFSNSREISQEIPDVFTSRTSDETSREIPLIRTNGPLEGSLSDTEYEADDELRKIEKWTNMVENDSDDEDQWMAFSNNFITFTKVSCKEEIERWECIVKKDGYAVALRWIQNLRLADSNELYFTINLLKMFLKIHVKSDVIHRNLVTEVNGKVVNVEFFVESKADYDSFVRMARTLRPVIEEEEKLINDFLEMDTDSDNEPPLTVKEVLLEGEPIEIVEPKTPKGSPPMSPQPPRPYSCCDQIICECTRNDPIKYPLDYEEEPQETQAEPRKWWDIGPCPGDSENELEDLEDPRYQTQTYKLSDLWKNENGWGDEYYETNDKWYEPDEFQNDNWGLPESNEESDLLNVWGNDVATVAWHYTPQEMNSIVMSGFRWKQVIANQPIRFGKWECNMGCDEENHHIHRYCDWCEQRIDFYTPIEHKDRCKYGIGLGQIHHLW